MIIFGAWGDTTHTKGDYWKTRKTWCVVGDIIDLSDWLGDGQEIVDDAVDNHSLKVHVGQHLVIHRRVNEDFVETQLRYKTLCELHL